jgi:alpha-D-ribose 1-methylphosphonate 5-triphosphate synthase subunit PhnH
VSATDNLAPGFGDPVHHGQQTFRALLNALARPGRISRLPAPMGKVDGFGPAAAAFALALLDFETPVWLDQTSRGAASFLRFHCGCAIVDDTRRASFAFARGFDALPELTRFALGTDLEPEISTTLVIEVDDLYEDGPLLLTGPGIERQHRIGVSGFDAGRTAERAALHELFPRGIDIFLTCGERVCGLPRTTRMQLLRSEPCTSR